MKNKAKKLCFASSSGGHLEELLMLRPLMERYNSFIVTEKTAYEIAVPGIRCYYLQQVNRRERACMRRLIVNAFLSLRIFMIERPDVVISTGVLATIPLCLLCRIFGKKLVYI
ncbi:MAG: polysaccharide biosynthesis protein, partial [Lachnospiraceae bacterium]|nr:polysaccharide biosynthesis protein [Lachnospiraceae bacterium]